MESCFGGASKLSSVTDLVFISTGLCFFAKVLETVFFSKAVFSPSFLAGEPDSSAFTLLWSALASNIVNAFILYDDRGVFSRIGGSYILVLTIAKSIDFAIVYLIYSQNDSTGGCTCLKPWFRDSPQIIQNLINSYPPQNYQPPQMIVPAYRPVVYPTVVSSNNYPILNQKY